MPQDLVVPECVTGRLPFCKHPKNRVMASVGRVEMEKDHGSLRDSLLYTCSLPTCEFLLK